MKHYHFAKFEIGTELTGWKCWLPGSSFTSHPTGRIVCNVADIMFGVSDDWCAYIRTEEGIPFSFSSENDSSVAIDESEMLCFCFSLFSLSLSLSLFSIFCFVLFLFGCATRIEREMRGMIIVIFELKVFEYSRGGREVTYDQPCTRTEYQWQISWNLWPRFVSPGELSLISRWLTDTTAGAFSIFSPQ